MSDKTTVSKLSGLNTDQQCRILAGLVDDLQFQVTHMQRMGGFADSKALSMRSTRLEERVEKLELDGDMLKDVAAGHITLLEEHLKDRHNANMERDNDFDVINWRKIRRRMREWAERRGMLGRKRDISATRRDENRLVPARSMSPQQAATV